MQDLIGVSVENILILLAAAAFGFLTHLVAKVAEIRENDGSFGIRKYVRQAPYKTLLKAMTVAGTTLLIATPTLSVGAIVSAIAVGYAAESAGNHLKRLSP